MALAQVSAAPQRLFEHGQYIFIYGHVRTNQIVYSLSRTLNNNKSLEQLPYLGKQTVPARIRKDFWKPLATVYFPVAHQGLKAYRELREFRKRHEHEWNPEDLPGTTRKQWGRALRDQKANSIADLAAVLIRQAEIAALQAQRTEKKDSLAEAKIQEAHQELAEVQAHKKEMEKHMNESEESKQRYKQLKLRKMKLVKALQSPAPYEALLGRYSLQNDKRPLAKHGIGRLRGQSPRPNFQADGVKIQWADSYDAEYAATWPAQVIHEEMTRERGGRDRNTPPRPEALEETPLEEKISDVGQLLQVSKEPGIKVATPVESEEDEEELTRMQRLVMRLKYGAR
ncbi:MAG: hypothetical protein M1828_005268 [Chrysothrix sp. TS-e1954]|nr:MAG: hypothetical protein M1828_005268 [Chrysothrix sp. TS-e1954]